ncbi:hypothetical protein GCM10010191_27410 [Actinomadura vinacea]|uniref:Uncharacterized protein n=1 Tax=Actinomadura vinacea TaxID=115336 RepID=A0ABN3IW45_9ACTN
MDYVPTAALTHRPAGGAIIALEVLARHGDRLLSAVVHEPPPMAGLLPSSPEQGRTCSPAARTLLDGFARLTR